MRIALEYGLLNAGVDGQIAYYKSLGVSHVVLGSWGIPGYDEVGCLTPELLGPIQKPLAAAGIAIGGFWFGGNSIARMMDPEKGEDILARFFRSFETMKAADIGLAPVMNCVPVPDEGQRDALWARMVGVYGRLVDKADAAGVTIASHTHWTPNHLVWNAATLLKLMDDVPSPRNKALFCAGSEWSAGDSMRDSVEKLSHRIAMVHFRDSRERGPRCEEMPLGSGGTEFRDAVAALDRIGYDGLIRPEHVGTLAGERDRTASMALAVGFIRGIFHTLNLREG